MSVPPEFNKENTEAIESALSWLRQVAMSRNRNDSASLAAIPAPALNNEQAGPFASLSETLDEPDRLLLILSLSPHITHTLLEEILLVSGAGMPGRASNRIATTGLVQGAQFQGYLPTALTFLYLAAGENVGHRVQLMQWLSEGRSQLIKKEKVILAPHKPLEPVFSGVLYLPPPVIYDLLMIRPDSAPDNHGSL
ncbi:hypothetical protein AB9P05_19345 [Roseivirga sp. BDSF3-8]|uniref:hypothetical protein n=1 Tax=Roseivirga sp. BDSF3-8 TaxID=3241598 RepID=UPI00353195BE